MSDLDLLRAGGWSVAVHNDYRLNGERWTFWLFTHPDGTWIKGEGRTDDEALAAAHGAWNARPTEQSIRADQKERDAKAFMKALWPILGGNHTDAETWTEISDAISAAIRAGEG